MAASQNLGMLIASRFINGVAVGICSAQVPVYVSELAPPSKRGRVVGAQQWAITWGILIMFYMYVFSKHILKAHYSFILQELRMYIPGRAECFPSSMGSADASSSPLVRWPHFPSGIPALARFEG